MKNIVIGGNTGYESIRNGLMCIKKFAKDDDVVLIHDGNRPLTSAETISECIRVAKDKGNAITVIPVVEVVFAQKENHKELLNGCFLSQLLFNKKKTKKENRYAQFYALPHSSCRARR